MVKCTLVFFWAVIGLNLMPVAYAKENITVFAASSLTNVLSEIARDYQQDHKVNIRLSFASSSALARQIVYGAPADIYFPANQKWLDYVIEQKAVDANSRVTLLNNSLVLIASESSDLLAENYAVKNDAVKKHVLEFESLSLVESLQGGRLAIGDPDHVPVGEYAREALMYYQQWDTIKSHVARANNVRGALVLVERGEAPLGIVYQTDAIISSKVRSIATFSPQSHDAIEYPMVMVSDEPSIASQAFFEYLQSEDAKAVYIRHGFGVI
ncbi:molybdate ABC transporter substrate-binding protein [Vibrio sp. YMD68]|uniref:molybdate ABC transporter substrate-binding protein n=1 Tax=Vibrio sp. YMD68 TaxID=3042300 RepID=UPI00249A568B|nr:molybdate ABC transporter substrate-binding protein [Vibrio sp. YMD68]WGV98422.1 molybdate ABC transporter substrate-binding protein [Vibrio sp. YMD68]